MLIHLIDPNREVAAQYVLHEVRTANGRETIVGSIRFMNDVVIQVGLPMARSGSCFARKAMKRNPSDDR